MTQYETQLIQELRKLNNNLSDLNKELRRGRTMPTPTFPMPNTPVTPLPTTPKCDMLEIRYEK